MLNCTYLLYVISVLCCVLNAGCVVMDIYREVLCCVLIAGCVATDGYTEVLSMYERNYPEMLSQTYVLNGTIIVCLVSCEQRIM